MLTNLSIAQINLNDCNIYNQYCKQSIQRQTTSHDATALSNTKTTLENCYNEYLYLAFLISEDSIANVEIRIDSCIDVLNSINDTLYLAEIHALEASLYFFKASLSSLSGIYYLYKTNILINEAFKITGNSPFAYIEKGHILYHSPSYLGGDYNKAIEHYKKGILLLKKYFGHDLQCNWYYLNAHLWLAKSYEAIENFEEAIAIYSTMEKFAPSFEGIKRWRKICQQKVKRQNHL